MIKIKEPELNSLYTEEDIHSFILMEQRVWAAKEKNFKQQAMVHKKTLNMAMKRLLLVRHSLDVDLFLKGESIISTIGIRANYGEMVISMIMDAINDISSGSMTILHRPFILLSLDGSLIKDYEYFFYDEVRTPTVEISVSPMYRELILSPDEQEAALFFLRSLLIKENLEVLSSYS